MKIYLHDIKERFPEFEIRNYDEKAYFVGFNSDSRTILPEELFIPIIGEKFDGHDFIMQALNSGASVSLCESRYSLKVKDVTKPVIFVDSIREGLQKLLNFSTSFINVPIVAITGSAGKTTTRKMLSTILEGKGKVLSAEGSNINTVWGNAALLSRYVDEKYIVLECGMDNAGEIAWHMNSVDPDLGILLNVGYVHAEKLGSIEAVYEEKKNMADYLSKTGKPLILNVDDERLCRIIPEYNGKLITFGKKANVNYRITDVVTGDKGVNFKFEYENKEHGVHINVYGDGLAYNAVAAIAAAHELGLSIDDCVIYLEKFISERNRFEIMQLKNGSVLVNDAYNANPVSMEMSVQTFAKLYSRDKYHRVVVLGDMKELGKVAVQKHHELGELVSSLNFDEVYFAGEFFTDFGLGKEFKNVDEMAMKLKEIMKTTKKNTAILCKGSHSLGLYGIAELMKDL